MREPQSNLSVRVHERHECEIPATVRVIEDEREQLRLTGSAVNLDHNTPVTMIDCSTGGIGLNTTVFFPRFARIEVQVAADAETGRPAFSAVLRVRRVVMLDHTPRYFVGTSFEDPAIASSQSLRTLVEHIQMIDQSASSPQAGATGA